MYKIFRVDEYGKNNISRKEFAVAVTWAEAALSVETQESEVLTQCVDLTITVSMSQRELRWEGGGFTEKLDFHMANVFCTSSPDPRDKAFGKLATRLKASREYCAW